jgi:putative ABC transport system permease protein
MFLPSAGAGMLAIATAGPPTQFTVQIQNAVSEATPQLRVLKFVTLEQNMQFATYVDRMAVGLFATLGLLGIFLAAVGLYGMVAQSVYRRTHEIGIRMALGALPRDVFRMVLGDGLRLAAAGMPFGLAAAVLGAMTVSKLLFGVRPLDPLPYLLGSLPVLVIALFASHLPARRAARVDPADALRNE